MARRTSWNDVFVDVTVATGSQNSASLETGLTADEKEGRTLTRLIGELSLVSNSVAGAYGVQTLDIGVAIIDGDAFTAGAFPDPESAADEPPRGWIFRTRCGVAQNGTGTHIVNHFLCHLPRH